MSKRFEFERFDMRGLACDECDMSMTPRAEFDGEWVKARDAIDREAALLAQIRALEAQLKNARDPLETIAFSCEVSTLGEAIECARSALGQIRAKVEA